MPEKGISWFNITSTTIRVTTVLYWIVCILTSTPDWIILFKFLLINIAYGSYYDPILWIRVNHHIRRSYAFLGKRTNILLGIIKFFKLK